MKFHMVLPACVLLLWTLTAFVRCAGDIDVRSTSNGIVVSCDGRNDIISEIGKMVEKGELEYKDENTGEYTCFKSDTEATKIYVKFRSCDNCIEIDNSAIAGIVVGDVVATIVIGVAVYLIASQNGIGRSTSNKKSSDRQHLVRNEASASGSSNDHYQPLKHRGPRDVYDHLRH